MVFAAPLFLFSQTRALREFYVSHRPAFINMGMGIMTSWLSLRLLTKIVSDAGFLLSIVTERIGCTLCVLYPSFPMASGSATNSNKKWLGYVRSRPPWLPN
jgi:hypothetical protein